MKNSKITMRVDDDVKTKSVQIFKKLGLTTTQAIEMYLNAVIILK